MLLQNAEPTSEDLEAYLEQRVRNHCIHAYVLYSHHTHAHSLTHSLSTNSQAISRRQSLSFLCRCCCCCCRHRIIWIMKFIYTHTYTHAREHVYANNSTEMQGHLRTILGIVDAINPLTSSSQPKKNETALQTTRNRAELQRTTTYMKIDAETNSLGNICLPFAICAENKWAFCQRQRNAVCSPQNVVFFFFRHFSCGGCYATRRIMHE